MQIISLALAIASSNALASKPSVEELTQKIEQSYSSEIVSRKIESKRSFYLCKIEKIEIRGRDPITGIVRPVTISLYKSRRNFKKRTVIILPPTGGMNILDRGYANTFCGGGVSAAVISGWQYQNKITLDYNMHNEGALRAVAATRHVVEYLKQSGHESLGLMGTSIGAISSALVLGFEPRIDASVLITGSARFADVVATTVEKGATKLRESRMKAFNLKDLREYSEAVQKNVWVEPSDYLLRYGLKPSLLITATKDVTVLTQYQKELAELMKPKREIVLKGDHLDVIKRSFFYKRTIRSFFRKHLGSN